MMKINYTQLFTPSINRSLAYLSLFAIGSVFIEVVKYTTPGRTVTLGVTIHILFALAGGLFISERRLLSRITSAAVMFAMAGIAISFGHSVTPDAYLLLTVFVLSLIGAVPALHRKNTKFKTTIYSISIVIASVAFSVLFSYIVLMSNRVVMDP